MQTVGIGLKAAVGAAVRLLRAHPQAVDGIVAAAMLAVSLIWLRTYPYEPGRRLVYSRQDSQHTDFHPIGLLGYALTVGSCAVLALRRRCPVPMMWASCAMIVLYTGLDYPPTTIAWGPVLIFYTLCTKQPPQRVVPYALAVFVVWLQYSLKLVVLGVLLAVLQTLLVIGVVGVFGNQTRRLAERNERLGQLSEQLRREQAARAREAVASERVRIARELHDVVAHHMSVISVQTGLAGYVLRSDPATAGQSLGTIGDATHEAMREMRRMLAVLRPVPEDGVAEAAYRPSVEPSPGLAQVPRLLERVRAAGVQAELAVTGTPFDLAPGPDLCCYRVVQESLTNVMKHAPGARATVELVYQDHGDIRIRVADDGGRVRSLTEGAVAVPTPLGPAVAGSGNGLVGMRERARIYGGTLQTGPRAAGGFEVVLTLPGEREADPEP
ncbi:signal transduction histidine kinase [Catenulispora sp. GP43]|uniref:sensor histidine kinase n=1 Tax=Catenulispora sp. GP43 TaxID=3156263 RepID=UPI003515025B